MSTIKLLVVEPDASICEKIAFAFKASSNNIFDIEFSTPAKASGDTYDCERFDAMAIDFEPDHRLAMLAARSFKQTCADGIILALARSYNSLVPVEIIDLGIGRVVILDNKGIETISAIIQALLEKRSQGPAGLSSLGVESLELRDITDSLAYQNVSLIHLRNELAAEKNKMENVINSMADGIAFFDSNGKLEVINPVAQKLFPQLKPSGEQKLGDILKIVKEKATGQDSQRPSEPNAFEADLGDRVYRISIAKLAEAKGSLILFTDITNEKEYEKIKNDFTNMISHELRTPLTSIRASVDNFMQGYLGEVNETQLKFLKIIARNVDRQHELIDNMLDLAKYESNIMETYKENANLVGVVNMSVDQYSLVFKDKGVSLTFRPETPLPQVNMDQSLITQAVNNLLSNALKYTSKGDSVKVSLGMAQMEGDSYACLSVEDTGSGIALDKLGSVFDKYVQADSGSKRRSVGVGLGLAICNEIAKNHMGRITVDSELGEGSVFKMYFPVINVEESK